MKSPGCTSLFVISENHKKKIVKKIQRKIKDILKFYTPLQNIQEQQIVNRSSHRRYGFSSYIYLFIFLVCRERLFSSENYGKLIEKA